MLKINFNKPLFKLKSYFNLVGMEKLTINELDAVVAAIPNDYELKGSGFFCLRMKGGVTITGIYLPLTQNFDKIELKINYRRFSLSKFEQEVLASALSVKTNCEQ